ncbi:MAG TPA: OmpH family outer membrane protein [Caulobacterales bacterium]|jgi:Skp family chaperone for outer membrane proteins|nr:OmpH family outer membrane protein [Caulobacterales bacterium]
MSFIRPILAATALMIASVAAPVAALAASPVVVVDYQRLFQESAAGKDAQAKLKAIGDTINKELAPEQQGVANDQKALGPSFQGKTQQQVLDMLKADKTLAGKYQSYLQRAENLAGRQQLRANEYQATENKAINDVISAAQSVIADQMKARGASIALETGSTIATSKDADITDAVIAGLNKKITSVTVVKADLTKRPAGQ